MIRDLKFAAGGVAALVLAATFSRGRAPAPSAAAEPEPKFEERWQAATQPFLLPKPPVQVQVQVQEAEVASPPKVKVKVEKPKAEQDLCTRHGMHKTVTKHGHSWRCHK